MILTDTFVIWFKGNPKGSGDDYNIGHLHRAANHGIRDDNASKQVYVMMQNHENFINIPTMRTY